MKTGVVVRVMGGVVVTGPLASLARAADGAAMGNPAKVDLENLAKVDLGNLAKVDLGNQEKVDLENLVKVDMANPAKVEMTQLRRRHPSGVVGLNTIQRRLHLPGVDRMKTGVVVGVMDGVAMTGSLASLARVADGVDMANQAKVDLENLARVDLENQARVDQASQARVDLANLAKGHQADGVDGDPA